MRPEEYDVAELTRLMMQAGRLQNDVDDVDPIGMTDEEREDLYDARYHAHKLSRLLYRLTKAADEAWKQSQAEEE